ncbi:TPA: glycosyltransferase family 2 protein [Raoultella ornithinolytica]|nr:glycosyltransferase family 2 protein [Raoultella ornithinolytica]HDG9798274.1 glycosyltransferase family 2 protein [Raoultella ornithinolytica]HDG9803224.1 glycosyltransferase family 2 protein [Raoultella ornithinolytica]HDG9837297.1 glycosyltransferase family 2 protein [Raoultella ornithinolytica]HDH7828124.1 glycosyltransferase family 2 protein [Raoultella ornithinolytica]
MKKIEVLLATYNGEKFVREQIYSVLNNFDKISGYECKILVSDDKSTDKTVQIIKSLQEQEPRILFLDGEKKGGVRSNFYYLLEHADADYVFFCDQDDLWLPDKISVFLERFKSEEVSYNGPILVHSDLCVADANLSPINVSMFDYQKINKNPSFVELIVSNSVTGCVMACNRELIEGVKKSQIQNSIMHDWYIGLYASAFGRILFIEKSFILYRQHGGNQVGAKSFLIKDIFNLKGLRGKVKNASDSVIKTKKQAELFFSDFNEKLDKANKDILNSYISSFEEGQFFKRLKLFLFKDVNKKGLLRNIVFFFIYVFKS